MASWDTASTLGESSDYPVGTVWGSRGLDFYLLEVVRERLEVPDLRRRILALSQRWRVDATLVEDTELGRAIAQDLRRAGQASCILRRPRFDKLARMLAQSARFEAGQVFVPQDAPWLAGWMSELLAFPTGRHDDQVDFTSQALDYLAQHSFARQQDHTPRVRPAGRPRPQGIPRPLGYGPRLRDPLRGLEDDRESYQARRHARRASGEAKGRIIAFRRCHCHRVRQPLRVT